MSLTDRLPALIRTAQEMAKLQGASVDARVLSEARARLVLSGYENWNGGIDPYTLVLELPVSRFVEVEPDQHALENSIRDRIVLQTRVEAGESVSEVVIAPLPVDDVVTPSSAERRRESGEVLRSAASKTCWDGLTDGV